MFSLIYGWRQWRGQRLQWLFIALGLSLLSAMLLLLSQLYAQLAEPKPMWLGEAGSLVTVQRQDPRGLFKPISYVELNKLAQFPEISVDARIKLTKVSARIAEKWHYDLPVLYYSDNLPELLQLPEPFRDEAHAKSGVFISHWLWKVLDEPSLTGLEVMLDERTDWRYPVIGVLPPVLNRFTSHRPAIWLPMSEALRQVTERAGESIKNVSEKSIAFNENFPDYIAFARLAGSIDVATLAQRFEAIPTEWRPSVSLNEEKHQAVFLPGIELFPQQRALLLNYWWLLCCLTLFMASVVALNLVVSLLGQLVRRSHEFGVRRIFGAGLAALCRQCLLEQLPLVVVASVGGFAGYWLFTKLLGSVQVFQYYYGPAGLPFDFSVWLAATLMIVGFILLCSLLPLLLLARKTGFYRNRQAQSHRWQLRLLKLQLFLQLSVAGYTLVLAGSLQLLLWQQQQEIKHYDFAEVKASIMPSYQLDTQMQQGYLGALGPDQVAMSVTPFANNFGTAGLSALDGAEQQFEVFTMLLSDNYLSFIGAEVVAGDMVLSPNSVVLSQSVADLLRRPDQSYADLIGRDLHWSDPMPSSARIRGIVADLPHLGVGQVQRPLMYLTFQALRDYPIPWFNVVSRPPLLDTVLDELDVWAERHALLVETMPDRLISEQLQTKNESQWLLTQLSLWMALLICVLTCVSLYYQVNAQLALQQQRLGTMLALGAQRSSLIGRLCGLHLLLLLAAVPVVAAMLYGLSPWLASKMGSTVFLPQVVPMVVALLLLMVLLASWLPAQWRLRRPISQLLQAR